MTAVHDPLVLGSRTDADRDRFRFQTADGVPDADAFCPGELLALEHLWDRDLGRLRTIDARYGVLGVVLAAVASGVEITASSARAAALCERNVAANGADATVRLATGLAALDDSPAVEARAEDRPFEAFDTVAFVPKAYDPIELGTRRIRIALDSLAPGDDLFLAAKPETGLERYESALADAAETVSTVGTRDDWALLRATAPARVELPAEPPFRQVRATVDSVDLTFVTAPGLFSPAELDAGTRLLAETAAIRDGDAVLDCCCGYGPLGAYAGAVADCEIWCSDDDALATACARQTLDENGVDGRVVTGDCTSGIADSTFDTVLCNPPTHAGDGVLADLFRGIGGVLAPDGRFWFVHHRSLSLDRHTAPFGSVETVATGREHVVRLARC
ncbi:methyltransferase [Halosimplex sp. TS25]|uniref:class I SAM-dependent methyltransferase n=1 Tax=Halosimplex rarum TaxID=3396619 RepID=UPI0039EA08F2